jgi:RNA polymerase sigma-70 factor (ECF subfamily)
MYPATANGQPAAVTYRRAGPGQSYAPFGVAVLRTRAAHLAGITAFTDPALVTRFGYPGCPRDWRQ